MEVTGAVIIVPAYFNDRMTGDDADELLDLMSSGF